MQRTMSRLALLLLLCGCTRLQTFRVVDSQSGQPIEGVQVERLNSSIQPSAMPFVLLKSLSPVEKEVTDSSGMSRFKESGTQAMLNPDSKNAAYGKAYVSTSWSGVKVLYPDDYRQISVTPVDGVVEIPLPSRHKASPAKQHQIADFNETEADRLGLGGSDTTNRDTHPAGSEEAAGQEKRR
jgi:hypothetical protein